MTKQEKFEHAVAQISMGQIIDVADGFARNYLVPRGLAVEANTKNIKSLNIFRR